MIDYFFTFSKARHRIQLTVIDFIDCEIGTIDTSDHSPVTLTMSINNNPKSTISRLNSSILNNLQTKEQIKNEIETQGE